jgi:putative Ca2+/H+ antiporter (TMEM165/GDT1 family)
VVAITSTATFFLTALVIWFKRGDEGSMRRDSENYFSRAALTTFATILCPEWGDAGQIVAATLTARY